MKKLWIATIIVLMVIATLAAALAVPSTSNKAPNPVAVQLDNSERPGVFWCASLLAAFEETYGANKGDRKYTMVTDINKDGVINMIDFVMYARNRNNQRWCMNKFARVL